MCQQKLTGSPHLGGGWWGFSSMCRATWPLSHLRHWGLSHQTGTRWSKGVRKQHSGGMLARDSGDSGNIGKMEGSLPQTGSL